MSAQVNTRRPGRRPGIHSRFEVPVVWPASLLAAADAKATDDGYETSEVIRELGSAYAWEDPRTGDYEMPGEPLKEWLDLAGVYACSNTTTRRQAIFPSEAIVTVIAERAWSEIRPELMKNDVMSFNPPGPGCGVALRILLAAYVAGHVSIDLRPPLMTTFATA